MAEGDVPVTAPAIDPAVQRRRRGRWLFGGRRQDSYAVLRQRYDGVMREAEHHAMRGDPREAGLILRDALEIRRVIDARYPTSGSGQGEYDGLLEYARSLERENTRLVAALAERSATELPRYLVLPAGVSANDVAFIAAESAKPSPIYQCVEYDRQLRIRSDGESVCDT